jgi:hypothetical protein
MLVTVLCILFREYDDDNGDDDNDDKTHNLIIISNQANPNP